MLCRFLLARLQLYLARQINPPTVQINIVSLRKKSQLSINNWLVVSLKILLYTFIIDGNTIPNDGTQ
ncbi:hypothetical protein CF132_08245 [Aeromonas dhakensis]|nr:hypothetical protein CF132_08245 [Aeromonas dhakensis]TNI52140.1 hypothetical protein CF126_21370 [Aeromonas dhakensis]